MNVIDAARNWVAGLIAAPRPRHADYILPVHSTGWAWWEINYALIAYVEGWADFERDKSMAEIIDVLTLEGVTA